MDKTSKLYQAYCQILKEELIPAMGCTEPIAIAYAAAKAREVLGKEPDSVKIGVSYNIIKNVKSVIVPNTGGMKGIQSAAAAGIVAGQADKALEVISQVSAKQKQDITEFLNRMEICVEPIDQGMIFDIVIRLGYGAESAVVRIAQYHTNIVYIEKNGEVLLDHTETINQPAVHDHTEEGLTDRSLLTVDDIYEFANTCDIQDVKDVLDRQIKYNTEISQEGLSHEWGANVGSTMLKYYGNDVRNRAIAKAAAGSDARMSGCEKPVIINSGSGNQGMTVSIPVIEYAKELNCSQEKLYRALTLSNLIAIHEKSGIGRLSAYCGAVSAGCAAGCGIAYLHDADNEGIAHTLVNALAIVSGIICDGAKPSCAAKIASSVEAGILGYHMYLNGQEFRGGDGIVKKGVENTIRNVSRLGREGMRETDKEIVNIMMEC
ncbi:serine dehydratase subunit alpha family protein [Allobaculum stercoricanis]|uniref:L-cysteine desulfidase family protein n=1 Tax=Allobaculum stercoricanis TaxID=174709 RepID=UPI0023F2DE66|nr:L-serine ammonia-lyase, iron-sulfur-dependent, subunit alpha [Allobaculum stercoricanis]